jgi:hypothetical protein
MKVMFSELIPQIIHEMVFLIVHKISKAANEARDGLGW